MRPYNKEKIYTKSDDHLSFQEKVDILKNSTKIEDDALYASIAGLYAQNNNWVDAQSSMVNAIKLNPLEPSYHLNLAHYYVEVNKPRLAYQEAKIANDLNAYDPNLDELLAQMAIETGDSIEGASFVERYYNSNPKVEKAQLLKARLALYQNDLQQAKTLVELGLRVDSLNKKGLQTAFELYKKLNDSDKTEESGKKLIDLDSLNTLYIKQLAKWYKTEGDSQKAAHYYYSLYKLDPQFEDLKFVINYQKEREQFDSVLYLTDSLISGSFYSDKNLLIERARAFDKRYKYDDSYVVYSQLLERDTADSVVLAERSIVQRKIAYLQRKRQEKRRLADSLANAMPTINF